MNNSFDLENIHNFLKGVNRFYGQFDRRKTNQTIVWQEGSTKVIDYSNQNKAYLPCLFFIPSLINKSYILDLDEESSLVRHFAELGYKVYLIDFAEPQIEELNMSFADYQMRISKAIQDVCKKEAVITIGYCLGGIFACNMSSMSNIVGQILIATPVDFSHFNKQFSLNNPLVFNNITYMLESLDRVPPSMVQLFFSYLSPMRIWDKFCQFSTANNQEEIDKFLSIEQWINDGISLSKKFGLEALSIIANNKLGMSIGNNQTPSLIINGSEDNIAPISSSAPLYNSLLNKDILVEKTGHIGLIISKLSHQKIWPRMEQWIKNQTLP